MFGAADGVQRGAYVLIVHPAPTPRRCCSRRSSSPRARRCRSRVEARRAARRTAGVRAHVVSMPSWELFARQPASYRDAVMPPAIRARVAIEAASSFGWSRWTTDTGIMLGMERFGAPAPIDRLFEDKFQLTPAHAAGAVEAGFSPGRLGMTANPLVRLGEPRSRAPRYDYITRDLVASGELGRLIEQDGLRGMTVEPDDLRESRRHEPSLRRRRSAGSPIGAGRAAEIFEAIAVADVQAACDVFRRRVPRLSSGDRRPGVARGRADAGARYRRYHPRSRAPVGTPSADQTR